MELYRRASAESWNDFRWHYLRGLVAADLGKQSEAEDALRVAAQLEAEAPFVQLRLATTVLEGGRPREALEMYERIAEDQPDAMAIHFGRGRALAALDRHEEAVVALELAASLDGDYRPLYYQLAQALRIVGRESESERFQAISEEMAPDRRPPFTDALSGQVEELREGSYLHHLNRGLRFEAAGQLEASLREYLRAVAAEPDRIHARANLISVYGRMGRDETAEETYRRTLEMNPNTEEAHYNYGVVLSGIGKHSEAEAAYRKALAVNQYSADARLNLGDALEHQGQVEAARKQFRLVLQVNPGHRLAHFRLGMSLHRENRNLEALDHFRSMTGTKDERTSQFLVVLARAERALGNNSAAALHVTEARRIARQYGQTEILAILEREFRSWD